MTNPLKYILICALYLLTRLESVLQKLGIFPRQTTPQKISERILSFCKEIAGRAPLYVPIDPVGVPRLCYPNGAKFIKDHSEGRIVFGWIVWESSLVLELEHHAVVQLSNGNYLDVTRQADGEDTILFLPHDIPAKAEILEEGGHIHLLNTRPANISSSRRGSITPSFGRCDLTEYFGVQSVSEAADKFAALHPVEVSVTERILSRAIGKTKQQRNAICACGSGKKFKKCCRR